MLRNEIEGIYKQNNTMKVNVLFILECAVIISPIIEIKMDSKATHFTDFLKTWKLFWIKGAENLSKSIKYSKRI